MPADLHEPDTSLCDQPSGEARRGAEDLGGLVDAYGWRVLLTIPVAPYAVQCLPSIPYGTARASSRDWEVPLTLDVLLPEPRPSRPTPAVVYVHGGLPAESARSALKQRGAYDSPADRGPCHISATRGGNVSVISGRLRSRRRHSHARLRHADGERTPSKLGFGSAVRSGPSSGNRPPSPPRCPARSR